MLFMSVLGSRSRGLPAASIDYLVSSRQVTEPVSTHKVHRPKDRQRRSSCDGHAHSCMHMCTHTPPKGSGQTLPISSSFGDWGSCSLWLCSHASVFKWTSSLFLPPSSVICPVQGYFSLGHLEILPCKVTYMGSRGWGGGVGTLLPVPLDNTLFAWPHPTLQAQT